MAALLLPDTYTSRPCSSMDQKSSDVLLHVTVQNQELTENTTVDESVRLA